MIRRSKVIKKDFALLIFLFLLVVLSISYPEEIFSYPLFVDWKTIIAFAGLLIIATGLKVSGYFRLVTKILLGNIKTERGLSFFMIFLSVALSPFLTNDITLFIVVPLVISVEDIIKNDIDIDKLVILEAISVNIGSTLTPIGNPQNLFLWHKWGISFISFVVKMFPLVVILLGILLVFAWFIVPKREIERFESEKEDKNRKNLFILSISLLIAYIVSLELGYAYWVLLPIFAIYFYFYKEVLLDVDWLLLLLLAIIFIDFHVIATIPGVEKIVNMLNLHPAGDVFLFSALVSQILSNVPASVFVSKFTHNWQAITYGVNVGGNGLAISSLANIIALRMRNNKRIWLKFHKYSILYFIISAGIIYTLFYIR